MVSWTWQRVSLKPVQPPPCWFSWIVLGAWPTFVLAGLIIQFAITGRGIHHEDGKRILYYKVHYFVWWNILMLINLISIAAGRKKPRPSTRGVTRADRAEMRQKKYRYLYQVRTAHGDVISQVNSNNCIVYIYTYKIYIRHSEFFRISFSSCRRRTARMDKANAVRFSRTQHTSQFCQTHS